MCGKKLNNIYYLFMNLVMVIKINVNGVNENCILLVLEYKNRSSEPRLEGTSFDLFEW